MQRFSTYRDFDWPLLGLIALLSLISVLEIKSATAMTKFHGFDHKQVGFLAIGLVLMFVVSLIDYHRLLDLAPWAYGVSIVALARCQNRRPESPWRQALDQSRRRRPLPAIRVGQARPHPRRRALHLQPRRPDLDWPDLGKAFALVCIPMALVLSQPDLGTALTYFPILIIGLFLGGIRPRQVAILLLGLAVLGGIAFLSGKRLKPYQQARINAFLDPDSDPKGSGYQIRQSKIAVGSGGIWGKGTNRGTQTQGDFLPIPYTDFIFAALSEEHGFVGALAVLLLYFLILMRLVQNAQTASDIPGTLIIMGIVAVLIFQIAVNIGMVVGLMPVTGIPLPLLSYGGSSVLFTFLSLGIVMNIRMSRFVN